jgi:hypothetical protein
LTTFSGKNCPSGKVICAFFVRLIEVLLYIETKKKIKDTNWRVRSRDANQPITDVRVLQIPPGATFQLAQYMGAGGGQGGGRRLSEVALPQPQIVSQNQVAVNLENVGGGYFYLTGGVSPLVTAAPGKSRV